MRNCSCRNEKSKQKNCQFVKKLTVFRTWRRERDLNPRIHSCITRFRIVRVQPLRHLCNSFYIIYHSPKKSNCFLSIFYRKNRVISTETTLFLSLVCIISAKVPLDCTIPRSTPTQTDRSPHTPRLRRPYPPPRSTNRVPAYLSYRL